MGCVRERRSSRAVLKNKQEEGAPGLRSGSKPRHTGTRQELEAALPTQTR